MRIASLKMCGIAAVAVVVMTVCGAENTAVAAGYSPAQLRSEKNGADYLVVAPAAFADALKPLLDRRAAEGLRVAVVTPEAIRKQFPRAATGAEMILSFVRYAYFHWTEPAPKYLLLVGDTTASGTYSPKDITMPTFYVPTSVSPETASDNPYADMDGDELPDISVGRLPADNAAELELMVKKIIEYETAPPPGEWRRRVSMFASEGHFGKGFDSMLEEIFKKLVNHNVSPEFDLNMTYASPGMAYFYIPEKFGDKVIDRFNEGSLFMVYIGHGQVKGFDDVRWGKERIPIMSLKDVPAVDNAGKRQILFIIACYTGAFANNKVDSIGEQMFKSGTGPVGVFASSEVSHPYSNSILAKDIAYYFMMERPERVGDGVLKVKRGLVERQDEDRKFMDMQAKLLFSAREMESLNREHLYLYNYLGDPAMRVMYAEASLKVSAPEEASPGDDVRVRVAGGGGNISVTLECRPTEIIYDTVDIEGLKGDELSKAIEKNYAAANNKVAVRAEADEAGEAVLRVPGWLPEGEYYLKAYAAGAKDADGFARITIKKRGAR